MRSSVRSVLLPIAALLVLHASVTAFLQPASPVFTKRTLGRVALSANDKGGNEREPWKLGRFVRTIAFFNAPKPPSLRRAIRRVRGKDRKLEGDANSPIGGVVLVTGATGGVGKRVVDLLLKRGVRVRALVRNKSKGLAMLSPENNDGLEMVVADVKDPISLRPSIFTDVVAVASCTSAIVQPKEGDGPDRAKYYQGIKFFEPEVLDIPEEVEYKGIEHVVSAVDKFSDVKGKVIFSCAPAFQKRWSQWGCLDDVVMGGASESSLSLTLKAGEEENSPAAVFSGKVTTANSGGFASVRTKNFNPLLDLSSYEGLTLRVKGDGNSYKFIVYDAPGWDRPSWVKSFPTEEGQWRDVFIPWSEFRPIFRAKTVENAAPMSTSSVYSFQLMLSKFEWDGKLNDSFEAGEFSLVLSSIKATTTAAVPRFVHISSGGVTRPGRPGLDVDKEPPAVRMNDQLGGLLTYKLKGEDVIRESGIPYTIIRPCALTEEPRGAPLELAQGDEVKGKVPRDDVAELVVGALLTPEAANLTLEVKSTVPFSEQWAGSDEKRDYKSLFGGLKQNITGKEWMD